MSTASMEGAFLSFSNLDGADMSGVQLQALVGGKAATLEGAFMRDASLSGVNLTGVRAQNVNFYPANGGIADATGLTAPGADFNGAYLAFAEFSGVGSTQGRYQSRVFPVGRAAAVSARSERVIREPVQRLVQ